jgi:hypothetical protein
VCSWLGWPVATVAAAATLTLASVFSAMIVACVQWFCLCMCCVVAMLFVWAHEPAARRDRRQGSHTFRRAGQRLCILHASSVGGGYSCPGRATQLWFAFSSWRQAPCVSLVATTQNTKYDFEGNQHCITLSCVELCTQTARYARQALRNACILSVREAQHSQNKNQYT